MCVCVCVCACVLYNVTIHKNAFTKRYQFRGTCNLLVLCPEYVIIPLQFLTGTILALFTNPSLFSIFTDSKGDHNYRWRTMDDNASPEKLWFKAAVIAVPIAGGFILIFLVLLAVRMLRSDTKRHRRLMEMRKHRSLTKAQLYVADHFIDKSDSLIHTNALEKQNHIYKNVNIKIDCDGTIYEKQKNTDICDRPGSVSSVIVWGGDKNKDSEPSNV